MRIRVIFIGHENRAFIAEQKKYRESLVSAGTRIEITSIKEGPETVEQNLDEVLASPPFSRKHRKHLSGKENLPPSASSFPHK